MKTVARLAGDNLQRIFNTDAVGIMLLDDQHGMIRSYYEYDKDEGGVLEELYSFPMGTGLTSKVINSGTPLIVNTLEEGLANGAI